MHIDAVFQDLNRELGRIRFTAPIACVYNPLEYAQEPHRQYWRRYGQPPREVVFFGMNPGPWGMAQTGVPFGDAGMVRDWLGIEAPVGRPAVVHPKRPVDGFACPRGEVSGQRFWGWAKERFQSPEKFFDRFFVANYCPLVFMEESGRNRTPDKVPAAERRKLLAVCDRALSRVVDYLTPQSVVGIGKFAAERAAAALAGRDIFIGRITHPSPANPRAAKGWGRLVEKEMAEMGIAAGPRS